MSEPTPMERFQQLIDSMPDEPDDYPTTRRASFSCTMCGSWNWPNPASSCPLCRCDEEGGEDDDEDDSGLGLKVHEDAYRELERELAAVTEQRDRLAEALRGITDVAERVDGWESFPSKPIKIAREALAAVEGGQP